jgi:hypothetical protein
VFVCRTTKQFEGQATGIDENFNIALRGLDLVSASAFAQSSMSLYGILDTGIDYVSRANVAGGRA